MSCSLVVILYGIYNVSKFSFVIEFLYFIKKIIEIGLLMYRNLFLHYKKTSVIDNFT